MPALFASSHFYAAFFALLICLSDSRDTAYVFSYTIFYLSRRKGLGFMYVCIWTYFLQKLYSSLLG